MKEYKFVYLNKGIRMSREKDLDVAAETLNQWVADGWTVEQVVSPNDGLGALVALLSKEQRM